MFEISAREQLFCALTLVRIPVRAKSHRGSNAPAGNKLPTHPCYPAAHAVNARACATVLKAFVDESYTIPQPVEAPHGANRFSHAAPNAPHAAGALEYKSVQGNSHARCHRSRL